MPYAISGDVKIYYEVKGSGPPLLLIEGLGYASWMWIMQVDDLSKDHKLIIFDNRGVGKSDKPNYPYTMDMFADDAKVVLREANIAAAHILGVSMGGMIAQKFALKYPEMVKSLILVSTHHGGPEIEPIPKETLQAMFGEPPPNIRTEKELYMYKMSYAFSREWFESNNETVERLIELRLQEPQPWEAYMNQAYATVSFNASSELPRIRAPTLIVHGDADRVVPVANAFKLHSKLKNSSLVIFRGAGHLLIVERASEFNNVVRSFIKMVEEDNYKPSKKPTYL